MGLVVLAIQMWITYRFDFSTAWHAATLVSTETVLGQVVRVVWSSFYLIPLLIVLTYAIFKPRRLVPDPPIPSGLPELSTPSASLTPEEVRQIQEQIETWEDREREKRARWREQVDGELARWKQYRRIGPLLVKPFSRGEQARLGFVAGAYLALFILLQPIVLLVTGQPGAALINLFQHLVRILLLCGMLFGLAYVQDIGHRRDTSVWWRLSWTAAVIYIYLTLNAVTNAKLNDPPLPKVELSQSGTTVQGHLLSQGDGYWKMIVEPEGQIRYISADEVDSATISK